jgi:hypothetical protein
MMVRVHALSSLGWAAQASSLARASALSVARVAMPSATAAYCSASSPDTDSASASLPKPLPSWSAGKDEAGPVSSPNRSRTLLSYSKRVSRRSGARSGAARPAPSAQSGSPAGQLPDGGESEPRPLGPSGDTRLPSQAASEHSEIASKRTKRMTTTFLPGGSRGEDHGSHGRFVLPTANLSLSSMKTERRCSGSNATGLFFSERVLLRAETGLDYIAPQSSVPSVIHTTG